MIRSMTAFASRSGALDGSQWTWDIRSVNARGLDLRVRLPDIASGLEQKVRAELAKRFARGNITLGLRLSREEGTTRLELDPMALETVLQALGQVRQRAELQGVPVENPTSADILGIKGVLTQPQVEDDADALLAAIWADFLPLLDDFAAMRESEGAALHTVVSEQLDKIDQLVAEASVAADARRPEVRAAMKAALERVSEDIPKVDEARLAQELAVVAMKQDVTEELDRLRAHVPAARKLIGDAAPAGRKLDFLAQEFNRETNTLCSKSQAIGLTSLGLELKAVIEQMREQIQNVE